MNVQDRVITVEELKTYFFTKAGTARAVDGVSFFVDKGKITGLVGESGSGKSVTGLSIIGLVDEPGKVVGGRIFFSNKNLLDLSEKEMCRIRGARIAMIFQDAMMTLNPVLSIKTQMIEALLEHSKIEKREAIELAANALHQVGIPSPVERLKAYPHQFSGGMRQRVVIAIAMLNKPELIIADEPTTALDVTIQAQILYEMQKLCREMGTAVIWITHDLSVLAGLADYVCVMYAGKIVEQGEVNEILDRPLHPYTIGLVGSVPSHNTRGKQLFQIPGVAPTPLDLPHGCSFYDRCKWADKACLEEPFETTPFKGHIVRCFHPRMERSSV